MPMTASRSGFALRRAKLSWLILLAWAVDVLLSQQIDPKGAVQEEGNTFLAELDGEPHRLGVVLDANYRWLYDSASKSCSSANESAQESCYLQGSDKESYQGTYGIFVGADPESTEVGLGYAALGQYASTPNYGSRVFVTDMSAEGGGYYLFKLINRELSFTINLRNVPAGMNAAVYLVMSCCPEMDLFEGNRLAAAMTAHPCAAAVQSTCDTSAGKCTNPCDTDGADTNLFRRHGPGHAFFELIDTQKPIKVRTQFFADDMGLLARILQTYEQSGRSFSMNITDAGVADQKRTFGEANVFAAVGGLAQMGSALEKGMVLTLAIWSDAGANMNWLDSCASNATKSGYECANHTNFTGESDFREAWKQAPGAWRGPVDYYPDFASSFANRSVRFTYPSIPEWMVEQGPFQCSLGADSKYDCSKVPYGFAVSDIKVSPLEHLPVERVSWFTRLLIGVVGIALALAAAVFVGYRVWCGEKCGKPLLHDSSTDVSDDSSAE
mmetsp:Transcript_20152/g.65105  ORF Transcript_20152/g.65105 Transcript_20152/m.65105 type:complete len:497 (-) Transcript_20152:158-1648(-)